MSAPGAPRGAASARRSALPRAFYDVDPLVLAPLLLNKLLVNGDRVGRIVEVEAYRGTDDPASHAFRGRTGRNATMFGRPGRLYVYFTYGMHFCANVVCMPEGVAGAVLLRALAPVEGVDAMRAARAAWSATHSPARAASPVGRSGPAAPVRPMAAHRLAGGPALLCQAMGITREHDGADLVTGAAGIRLLHDGTPPPTAPGVSGRVGLRLAGDLPWRWWVPDDPNVSRARARPVVHAS